MPTIISDALLAYARSSCRPCCGLVACAVLGLLHGAPLDPSDERAWARLDLAAWRELMVWDAEQPWSAIEAAARLLGGRVLRPAPEGLVPGQWHVVQRWSEDLGHGHTYLVLPLEPGRYRVVQSSVARGYRDEILSTWRPAACEAGVAVLPQEIA